MRADIPSIESIVKNRLRWFGHLWRMEEHRLPKQLLYGELQRVCRRRGAPKKRFKDQCKRNFLDAGIDPMMWEEEAVERSDWRGRIHSGVIQFEINRASEAEARKQRRKERANAPRPVPQIPCHLCPRMFHARICLASHLKMHQRRQRR